MKTFIASKYNFNNPELVSVIDELPLWSAPFGFTLLDKIKYRKNLTVLDIGSGTGFPLIEIAQRLGSTCKVYGIDPWETAIERIKLKLKVYDVTNVEMIKGVAEALPFEDEFFDLIVSNNGLNNVADIEKVLSECYRVCKNGAQLLFTYNLPDSMMEFYNLFEETLRELNLINEIEKMKEHINHKRKPTEFYFELLHKTNFITSEVSCNEFKFKYTDGTTMLNHFFIRLAFLESWIEILPNDKQVLAFNLIETKLNNLANETGELNLTIPYAFIECIKGE
jgi:ubiquinone/menaquinone biosynthesis C-methylase UbiE